MSIQCISLLISHTCSLQRREEHGRSHETLGFTGFGGGGWNDRIYI